MQRINMKGFRDLLSIFAINYTLNSLLLLFRSYIIPSDFISLSLILGSSFIYTRIIQTLDKQPPAENSRNGDRAADIRRQVTRMLVINGLLFFLLNVLVSTSVCDHWLL